MEKAKAKTGRQNCTLTAVFSAYFGLEKENALILIRIEPCQAGRQLNGHYDMNNEGMYIYIRKIAVKLFL